MKSHNAMMIAALAGAMGALNGPALGVSNHVTHQAPNKPRGTSAKAKKARRKERAKGRAK